jgi:hypothetical protein
MSIVLVVRRVIRNISTKTGYMNTKFMSKINIEISPIAEHCINRNYVMDWEKSAVIKTSDNCFERNIYESIIRSFDQKVLLNRDIGQQLSNI